MTTELDEWKLKYARLLDSATDLRGAMKDIYNLVSFDVPTMPAEILRRVPGVAREIAEEALKGSALIATESWAAEAEEMREWKESQKGVVG